MSALRRPCRGTCGWSLIVVGGLLAAPALGQDVYDDLDAFARGEDEEEDDDDDRDRDSDRGFDLPGAGGEDPGGSGQDRDLDPGGSPDRDEPRGGADLDRPEPYSPDEPIEDDAPAIPPPEAASSVPRRTRFFRDISRGLPPGTITAVAADPGDPDVFLIGSDGFVFKTDDGGESWRPVLSFARGLPADVFLNGDPDDDEAAAAREGVDPVALRGFDADDAEQQDNGDPLDGEIDPGSSVDLGRDSTDDEFAVDGDDDMPSGDLDIQGPALPPQQAGVRRLRFVSGAVATIYAATPRGLYKSVDVGESWVRVDIPGGTPSQDVRDVAVGGGEGTSVWAATRGGLWRSDDGGATFALVPLAGLPDVLSLAVGRWQRQDLVVVGTDQGVFRSWDGGGSFRKLLLLGAPPTQPVHVVAFDEQAAVLYAGTSLGLFVAERRVAILERRRIFAGNVVMAIAPDPARPRGVALGIQGVGLVLSEDTGFSTVPLEERFPAFAARALDRRQGDSDALLIGTERGAFLHDEGSGIQVSSDQLRRLQDLFEREPTLAETIEAALRYASVHPAGLRSLERRARYAFFAPRVQVLYRFTWGRPEEQDEYVLTEYEPEDFDEDEYKDVIELFDLGLAQRAPQRGTNHVFWVLMQWDLDRALFNPFERLAVAHRTVQRSVESRVVNRIQVTFGARRRVLSEILLGASDDDVVGLTARLLRLRELTATLDGATGGAYSQEAEARGFSEAELLRQAGVASPEAVLDLVPARTTGALPASLSSTRPVGHVPRGAAPAAAGASPWGLPGRASSGSPQRYPVLFPSPFALSSAGTNAPPTTPDSRQRR